MVSRDGFSKASDRSRVYDVELKARVNITQCHRPHCGRTGRAEREDNAE
jgi:hypothetical protein